MLGPTVLLRKVSGHENITILNWQHKSSGMQGILIQLRLPNEN